MKTTTLILTVNAAMIITACSTIQKNKTAATTPNAEIQGAPATQQVPLPFVIQASGVNAPEEKELAAIQQQFKDVTMEQLTEGYTLYTQGACINCHQAKNIYSRPQELWKDIIDNMASMAKITDTQRDAVYKYVLAIKATQPK